MTEPEAAAVRALAELGLAASSVTAHGDVARIVAAPADAERLVAPDLRAAAVDAVRAAGFRFVSLDLDDAPTERARTWRDIVFAQRGTLLALPAISLVAFGRPTPVSIALGVPVAVAGEILRCWAVGYSGVTTRSDRVEAPALTTAGPYAYVRNPLYVGNFLTALGFTIAFAGDLSPKRRALLATAGLGTMLGVYAAIVPLEEAYLRETFGASFDAYAARVPRIVPRLSPSEPQAGTYDAGVIAKAETRTFATFGAMLAALALKAFLA